MMTSRLVDEIIWDTRKSYGLKKFDASTKTPCLLKLADKSKFEQVPQELKDDVLMLHSFVSMKKVICHCAPSVLADSTPNKDQTKFSIPLGYAGLVEVLSENGKSAMPLTTISDVAKQKPARFLVRSRALALADVKDPCSTIHVERGSVMKVLGRVKVTSSRGDAAYYLHCSDDNGCYAYINFTTVGVFSPLAGPKNISGVHTITSLVKNFRLPLTVRVVSGKIPKEACSNDRPGVLRLLEVRNTKMAMFLPLGVRQQLISLPVQKDLSFYRPANMKEVSRHPIYQQVLDCCTSKVNTYMKTIQVLVCTQRWRDNYQQLLDAREEDKLFEQVDEIYPYIRRGGMPERMKTQSMCNEPSSTPMPLLERYTRSISQPALLKSDKASSLHSSTQVFRQRVVSSPTVETTLQFQCNSDNLTLGRKDVISKFIQKCTTSSRESLSSTSKYTVDSKVVTTPTSDASAESLYFTLEDDTSKQYVKHSIVDAIARSESVNVTGR